MTSEMGLRERKKLATRAALSQAAWSLMVEHGLDAVTPEAIAEAVDVSPRTFRNYFTSREEAILDELVRRAASVTEAIRARPASEPVWDSLVHVLPTVVAGLVGGRRDIVVLMGAIKCDPAMQAQHLVTFERGHRASGGGHGRTHRHRCRARPGSAPAGRRHGRRTSHLDGNVGGR